MQTRDAGLGAGRGKTLPRAVRARRQMRRRRLWTPSARSLARQATLGACRRVRPELAR